MPTPSPSLLPSPGLYPSGAGLFTTQLLDAFRPWLDAAPSTDLYFFLAAIGAMFDSLAGIVMDQGFPDDPGYSPGWGVLLDPDSCPTQFLPFLGQLVGVFIPPGTGDATARSALRAEAGFQRGTFAAITAATKRNLVATQSCIVLERQPNAYGFVVVVRPEEVTSVQAITDAVNAVRPAGLTWVLIQTDGWTIYQMEASQATITALEGAFSTISGLEGDQVGH